MNKSKLKKISSILNIFQVLNKKDIDFFLSHSSDKAIQLILEIIFNLIFNERVVDKIKDRELLESVRSSMKNNKRKWCDIIKSKNPKTKLRFIRKQTGAGVVLDICSLVLPIIITLL